MVPLWVLVRVATMEVLQPAKRLSISVPLTYVRTATVHRCGRQSLELITIQCSVRAVLVTTVQSQQAKHLSILIAPICVKIAIVQWLGHPLFALITLQ